MRRAASVIFPQFLLAQKLALARALYKDAPFVVLDEPTAALDPISEAQVYESFHEMVKDKTSIYISHRMSSCRFCDDIVVFDDGRIVERGSHEELLAAGGCCAGMWSARQSITQRILQGNKFLLDSAAVPALYC